MSRIVKRCLVCSTAIKVAPTGRPRMYCSNACRLRAQRQRAAAAGDPWEGIPLAVDDDPTDLEDLELSALDLQSDPDEALLTTIIGARKTAARFGALERVSRPQFAVGCRAMASLIADGLRRWFEP